MKNSIITAFEKKNFADLIDHPEFRAGDTVKVHYRIQESADKNKFRIQIFEGIVLRKKRGTANSTFTVRKISAGGIGVERVFPLYSAQIAKIEVAARGIVRRSRIYYLRDLTGKAARIKNKFVGTPKAKKVAAASASEKKTEQKAASTDAPKA